MNRIIAIIFLFISLLLLFPRNICGQVLINEFVPDSIQEWIELYNSSPSADYIKQYYIDDDIDFVSDSGSSAKKILTNLNTVNPLFPTVDTSSFLNNSGDWVVLFDSAGTLIDKFEYTSNPGKDISIGKFPDSSGQFLVLAYSTKADANAAPPTPVPTPTPTLNPTSVPTPTKTPTPTTTKSPTPRPILTTKPTSTPEVLGDSTQEASPDSVLGETSSPEPSDQVKTGSKKSAVILGAIFTGLGVFAMGIAGYAAYAKSKSSDS